MTESSSGQKRRTLTVLFAVTIGWIGMDAGWRGLFSPQPAQAGVSQAGPPKAQPLPDDLIGVSEAEYASLEGLAPGSQEAQERQRQIVQKLGLPLEVKTRKTGIVFRLVPAGSFIMGSPTAEEDRVQKPGVTREHVEGSKEHQVTLTQAFYCGKFEVTQGQWDQVMGGNPSRFKNAGRDAPVEMVNWGDCQAFVKRLSQMEGVPEGTYRLLTEAQWEYACRAGTETALYIGDLVIEGERNAPALDPIAWYGGNSGVDYEGAYWSGGWRERQYNHNLAGTHPVGGKRANGFGLCDMIGNVMEWCQDWMGYYPEGAATDPLGVVWSDMHVRRGGDWISIAWYCQSGTRIRLTPDNDRCFNVGLRLARTMPAYP